MTEDDYSKEQAKDFIKKMRVKLLHADLHISDLCRAIKMSPANMSRYKNGASGMGTDVQSRIELAVHELTKGKTK